MKFIKITLIVLGVIIVLLLIVLKLLGSKPVAPVDYQKNVQTLGAIETQYMQNGPYEVTVREDGVLQEFGKFITCYPSELATTNKKYPVIVMCNGSGTPMSKYMAVAKHYASWGFIVIGTEEKYSWNALGAELALKFLERWNKNERIENTESPFYQRVDFNNVGIIGHSQGGVGVINAITNTENKNFYKTAISLSPTNKQLAYNLLWEYDATKIDIPILIFAGEGGGDDWVLTLEQMQELYADIPSEKVMARRINTGHGETLYSEDGYVMAWFMWKLQGDELASKAFVGSNAELLENALYQDQKIEFQ